MSILIKGVNLPSGKIGDGKVTGLSIDIPVAAKPTCGVFYENALGYEDNIEYEIEVVEVPTPHGRLIDADTLDRAAQKEWDDNEITSGEWVRARERIRNVRTVIEREE